MHVSSINIIYVWRIESQMKIDISWERERKQSTTKKSEDKRENKRRRNGWDNVELNALFHVHVYSAQNNQLKKTHVAILRMNFAEIPKIYYYR